jgi:DNA-binding MurR/RpiR family transcriptional regulator
MGIQRQMPSANAILNHLESRAESLSKTQRTLARYVLENYQAVAFSTISELAQLSGVSEATIVRFADALGFDGYPDFQRELRRTLRVELKTGARQALDRAQHSAPDSPLTTVLAKELGNIAYLENNLDQANVKAAAKMLRRAEHILVVGARASASLAHHLWFALDKMRYPARLIDKYDSDAFDRISRMGPKDCVVLIGFPRYLARLVDISNYAHERGVKIITVTDSPLNPFKADVKLSAPINSSTFFGFHCAPLILVNTLLETLIRNNEAATVKALRDFEALAESAGYFHAE